MYALTGITGQVGRALARALEGQSIRAVIRDAGKAEAQTALGHEVAIAAMTDAAALTHAFSGAAAVFILLPPTFDPTPGFPEARAVIDAVKTALLAARPGRVIMLSTIGAQAPQSNLLNQLGLMEQALADLPMPVSFLRAGWFIENAAWDVVPARNGLIHSTLQPLDRAIPMVSVEDVGRVAAELLTTANPPRIVELQGPAPVSPRDIAAAFARLLGHPVAVEAISRHDWEGLFRGQGMTNPEPRMQMLDGFNAGWICFEGTPRLGTVDLDTALAALL